MKNAGNDKYKHSGYGTGFNNHGIFSLSNGNEFSKDVILFGADMSRHVGNKKNDILSLGKGQTDGLDYITLTAWKEYSINLTSHYIFINGAETHKFKVKDSEIKTTPLCLGNSSKDFSIDNLKKTKFHEYVYGLSVDYDAIDDILDSI